MSYDVMWSFTSDSAVQGNPVCRSKATIPRAVKSGLGCPREAKDYLKYRFTFVRILFYMWKWKKINKWWYQVQIKKTLPTAVKSGLDCPRDDKVSLKDRFVKPLFYLWKCKKKQTNKKAIYIV